MTPNINVDMFRKHYDDMISCRDTINTNAETLNSNEENAIEALIPIINEYGREMVKKLVVNAVLQNRQNYNEHIRKWADNAIISQFVFETDNVLSDYIPDHLSESAIERIANQIINKEKYNRVRAESSQGNEYEVIMTNRHRTLLSLTNPDNMVIYCQYPEGLNDIIDGKVKMDESYINKLSFDYREIYGEFLRDTQADEQRVMALEILGKQYADFKNDMLSKTPEEIFNACYKIVAFQDVYYHLAENTTLTSEQEQYIINSGENVVSDMGYDWYEYGDYSDTLRDHIDECWLEKNIECEDSMDEGEEME